MIDPAALRSLLAAATPGPWLGPRITDVWPPGCIGLYALDDHGEPAEIIGFTGYAADDERAEHDAALAAAAINALPELLDVYEAACALNDVMYIDHGDSLDFCGVGVCADPARVAQNLRDAVDAARKAEGK